jgi:hypothetical protein
MQGLDDGQHRSWSKLGVEGTPRLAMASRAQGAPARRAGNGWEQGGARREEGNAMLGAGASTGRSSTGGHGRREARRGQT